MGLSDDIDAVEVSINGHTARITLSRGSYVARFLDGPFADQEVDGLSPRKAWLALQELMKSFDRKHASVERQ